MPFVFTRIDDRFVHGQVGARIVKQFDCNRIAIIDDKVAADSFSRQLYGFSGDACGAKVEIYSVEEGAKAYKEGQFESKRYLLLFGNINTAYRALEAGVEYEELEVASIKVKRGEVKNKATDNVYIDANDAENLRAIEKHGVNAYFQLMPAVDSPVSIESGIKNAGF